MYHCSLRNFVKHSYLFICCSFCTYEIIVAIYFFNLFMHLYIDFTPSKNLDSKIKIYRLFRYHLQIFNENKVRQSLDPNLRINYETVLTKVLPAYDADFRRGVVC